MQKILIVGSNGQLGHDCLEVFKENNVIGLDLPEIDITSLESLCSVININKPDVIVNCAAYTNVDAAENDEENAWKVNALGPKNLAKICNEKKIFLLHISTDYVFAGNRSLPEASIESDATAPVSVYGTTKLEGENAVAAETSDYAILRTAWLYGIHGKNFLKTMLRLAEEDSERVIRVVSDQYGSPTFSRTLAKQIKEVVEYRATGIFHAAGEGYCSWYDLAKTFLEQYGIPFKMEACTSDEYPTAAKRPTNSILENRRLKELKINVMVDWRVDLAEFTKLLKERTDV
jgi:dTDP-4-dehydrorhamnose reductase